MRSVPTSRYGETLWCPRDRATIVTMRFAGRPSWSLSVGDDQHLNAALYFRDALALVVEGDDVPPRLAEQPPLSNVLAGADLTVVGRDWLGWWRGLLALYLEQKHAPEGTGADWRAWVTENAARRDLIGGPADGFAGLAHAPDLQRACVALIRDAYAADRRAQGAALGARPWAETMRVVDEVAAEHGVDPNSLSGIVVVVPTAGRWWHVVEPGAVIASRDTDGDDVIRAAFVSSLGF
ncbi:hypothetical protein [Xylanimonas sp. McL0601]|uniref:hypothetical protein n=1 Tax=Xylanimonas sp. McL0601 TaxID=3414739 RepID=UPI003CE92761